MPVHGQHWPESLKNDVLRRLSQPGVIPTHVAKEMGLRPCTVRKLAKTLQQGEPIIVPPVEKPRYRVPYNRASLSDYSRNQVNSLTSDAVEPAPSGDAIRVTVIGDLHVSPGQDLSRLKWIARHVGETRPDHVVQIGDWASFDSVSTHDPIGSIKASRRPSLRQDMDCLRESLQLFDRELGPSVIPRTVCLGNHEERVRRYEQLRSELEDSIWTELLQEFAQWRWKTHDYGKVAFIGGCGMTHVPFNRIGKTHSSPNIIGNNLSHDLIYGHSHQAGHWSCPKIGENHGVTLLNVGTALPHGHIEPYAKLSQTGWWWGIYEVTIRNGRIDDYSRVSMATLAERYA